MQKYLLMIAALFCNLDAVDYRNILFDSKTITGVYTRTCSDTENTDIPALWETFRQEIYDKLPDAKDNRVYVIYTDYTGDCRQNNPYTVIIGYESSFFASLDTSVFAPEELRRTLGMSGAEVTSITIPEGVYKVAQKSGAFPDAIIALWDDIYNSGYQQIHTINFEVYDGDLDAEPHIKVYLATGD